MGGEALKARLASALGSRVLRSTALAGGSINEVRALELADGRRVVLKLNEGAPAAMFEAEAAGLAWLSSAGGLTIPEVLAVDGDGRFLILEWLGPHARAAAHTGESAAKFDEGLGRGLAALHGSLAEGAPVGLERDNFIATLVQGNDARPLESWATFYGRRRLAPMIEEVAAQGLASPDLRRDFDRLRARLPGLCGPPERPARLHGDLWAGNVHADLRGDPALIDPAAYAGHREMDLAMMRLFGGFSSRVFAAYDEVWPLAPGADERVGLYQLYPLLVHVALFGASYLGAVEAQLRRLS